MPRLSEIEVELTIEVGGAEMPLSRLVGLKRGAFIPLDADVDTPLPILANGRRVAAGRVALDGDRVKIEVAG